MSKSERSMWSSSFTFHYVSTYTNNCDTRSKAARIYIPLCFYLYFTRIFCPAHMTYLHSTMFLLIPFKRLPKHLDIHHLHSTMFLLILERVPVLAPRIHIYIPLCFYLYWNREYFLYNLYVIYIPLCFYLYFCFLGLHGFKRMYLHSTMFLLIRLHFQPLPHSHIHLHSTMFLLILIAEINRDVHWLHLHSTMFLLIPECRSDFTRHAYKFTFHYVSTYTTRMESRRHIFINLHSTMFLLIPLLGVHWKIPYPFTFHYVSTYTAVSDCCARHGSSFTFHYVSTYTSFRWQMSPISGFIYIPLCFYLYLSQWILLPTTISIYIPLCFYLYWKMCCSILHER